MIFNNKKINVAVVGATGIVGITALKILEKRHILINNIYALASNKSTGKEITFQGRKLIIKNLSNFDFSKTDVALFCVNSSIAEKFIPKAVKAGCFVIDNSSHFRMNRDVPLIVPEVNSCDIKKAQKKIIANPNCVAIPLAVVIAPLHKKLRIKRIIISTYQSVSGAGRTAIDELWTQTQNIFEKKDIVATKFSKQIAFNLIPHIDKFDKDGFTKEENKIRNEIKKIVDPHIETTATCVRVPVFNSHSISANIEFVESVSTKKMITLLENAKGITIADKDKKENCSSPIETAGQDDVYVSRIRKDPSITNGACMWISSDNICKGAALNAVQILENLLSISKETKHENKQVDKIHI